MTDLDNILKSRDITLTTKVHLVKAMFFSIVMYGWVKAMAIHSSILAWRIPGTEEPGELQSMGLQRLGHGWVTSTFTFTFRYADNTSLVAKSEEELKSLLMR